MITLDATGCLLTSAHATQIATLWLKNISNLVHLDLFSNKFDAAVLDPLLRVLAKATGIRVAKIYGKGTSAETPSVLADALTINTTMQELCVTIDQFSQREVFIVRDGLRLNGGLTGLELQLGEVMLQMDDCLPLMDRRRLRQLLRLPLEHTFQDDMLTKRTPAPSRGTHSHTHRHTHTHTHTHTHKNARAVNVSHLRCCFCCCCCC